MACGPGTEDEVYKVGLQANHLLESVAETVIAWLMLKHAEVALPRVDEDPFYRGKVESAKWFLRHAAPKARVRRAAAEAEDGSLMSVPIAAF
jgi:hypothetical protein